MQTKSMKWITGMLFAVMVIAGVQTTSVAQERMDGISFFTTQVIVRLSDTFSTSELANANVLAIGPSGEPVQINTANEDGVFDGNTDWRENQLPVVVESGEYLWAHVFLNIVSPQVGQVNTASPNMILPVLYNLGEGLQFNILQINNNPQLGQDYVGPQSGPGFSAFPGAVSMAVQSNTELSLNIERNGNIAEGVYHIASIKFRVRNILEGGDSTRVEVTPAAWTVVGRVDQPDRIADAIIKRPAPQFIFNPIIKRHLIDLATVGEPVAEGNNVTITKTTVISSAFLQDHLGWSAENDIPVSLYPFPPYDVTFANPFTEETDWVPAGSTMQVQTDVNGDGNLETLGVSSSSVYNQDNNTLTVEYSVTGPAALETQLTDFVAGTPVRAIVDFHILEGQLEPGILR